MEKSMVLINTYDDLVDACLNSGFKIRSFCFIRRPVFTVIGSLVKMDDFKIQVYEYPDEDQRKQDLADAIQAGRFTKDQHNFRRDEIHCWSQGRLNILYYGSDRPTIRKLKQVLGPPYLGFSGYPTFRRHDRPNSSKK
jgi:hypothetical protein